jgi:hypothetical protein
LQNGVGIRVTATREDFAYGYTSEVTLERKSFQILIPKTHCDQASDVLLVHVITSASLAEVSERIDYMQRNYFLFDDVFPEYQTVVATPHFVTDMYGGAFRTPQRKAFEKAGSPFERSWNFFYGPRYSGTVDGKWLINLETINGNALSTLSDAGETGDSLVFVFGRPECVEQPRFWNIDVVGVNFSN